MAIAPTKYPDPGTKVQVSYHSKQGSVIHLQGVVFANRYPHMRLSVSSGGRVDDIPWERIETWRAL